MKLETQIYDFWNFKIFFRFFQFSKMSTSEKFEKKNQKKWKKFSKKFSQKKKISKNFFWPKMPEKPSFSYFLGFFSKKKIFRKIHFFAPYPLILVCPKKDIFFENFLVENIGGEKKSKMLTALTFFLEGVVQLDLTWCRFRTQRLR